MSCLPNERSLLREQGVTLLEVLVSLLLVAIVAVTAAASSVRAQQGQQQAYETSVATALGQDLIERVRANPEEIQSYQFSFYSKDKCPDASLSLASQDIHSWCSRATQKMPQLQVQLTPSDDHFDLTLSWQPRIAGGGYFTLRNDEGVTRSQLSWQAVSARTTHVP